MDLSDAENYSCDRPYSRFNFGLENIQVTKPDKARFFLLIPRLSSKIIAVKPVIALNIRVIDVAFWWQKNAVIRNLKKREWIIIRW